MKRIPIIDFFRFASIFAVIGGHFFPRWVAYYGYSPAIRQLILDAFLNGAYGVTCFFVVSGFLITQMLVGSRNDFSTINLKAFYIKRAARIFPLLSLIILVGLLMEHLKPLLGPRVQPYNAWNVDSGFGWSFWLSLLTFNFNWYLVAKNVAGVGIHWMVLWSLAVEEQFYFFYPLLLKALKTPRRVLGFLGGVVLFAVLFRGLGFFYAKANPHWMHEASFAAFDQIAIGGILYFLWDSLKDDLQRKQWICFMLCLFGSAICLELYVQTSFDNRGEVIIVPTLMALGCALAILGGLHMSFLNSAWAAILSWPGKLSYGCYLWHLTIMFILLPLLAWIGGLGALAFLLVCVWLFAFISYRYFEVPMNNWIRSFFGLKPSRSL